VYNTGAVSLNDDATVHGNTATSGTGGGIFNDCTAGVLVGATTTNVHDNTPDQLNNCIG
jgi:hypothetical protein